MYRQDFQERAVGGALRRMTGRAVGRRACRSVRRSVRCARVFMFGGAVLLGTALLGGCPSPLTEADVRALVQDELTTAGSATGTPGAVGAEGSQGDAGQAGGAGQSGNGGSSGGQGQDAAQGAQRQQGSTGSNGATGAQGQPGAAGPTGPQGPSGVAGQSGAAGSGGPPGGTGDPGPSGAAGAQGPTGPQGPAGNNGATGPAGSAGPAGTQGPPGSPGAQGPAGPAGAAGPPGSRGPRGLSCWDLNGNGIGDPDEDINGDGNFDTLDCRGAPGAPGTSGGDGAAGQACWDLNGNHIADPEEDINRDGVVDVRDCRGAPGSFNLATGVGLIRQDDTLALDLGFTDARYWKLGGNVPAGPVAFLGTSDGTALDIGVNMLRIVRLEPGRLSPNILSGHIGNNLGADITGAVLAGGGAPDMGSGTPEPNTALDDFVVIGGGLGNAAAGYAAVIAGGRGNGAYGDYSVVIGGLTNSAGAIGAVALGGERNAAAGMYSLAAGRRAKANNNGSFVWADGTDADFASQRNNEFRVRATGGVSLNVGSTQFVEVRVNGNRLMNASNGAYLSLGGSWTNASDRELKENIAAANTQATLERLAHLPIYNWNYIGEGPAVRRIGPMAQDFYAAFGYGDDDRHIGTVDAEGVAFAAIQALSQASAQQNDLLAQQNGRITQLETQVTQLQTANQTLLERLAALEARVGALEQGGGHP